MLSDGPLALDQDTISKFFCVKTGKLNLVEAEAWEIEVIGSQASLYLRGHDEKLRLLVRDRRIHCS